MWAAARPTGGKGGSGGGGSSGGASPVRGAWLPAVPDRPPMCVGKEWLGACCVLLARSAADDAALVYGAPPLRHTSHPCAPFPAHAHTPGACCAALAPRRCASRCGGCLTLRRPSGRRKGRKRRRRTPRPRPQLQSPRRGVPGAACPPGEVRPSWLEDRPASGAAPWHRLAGWAWLAGEPDGQRDPQAARPQRMLLAPTLSLHFLRDKATAIHLAWTL